MLWHGRAGDRIHCSHTRADGRCEPARVGRRFHLLAGFNRDASRRSTENSRRSAHGNSAVNSGDSDPGRRLGRSNTRGSS